MAIICMGTHGRKNVTAIKNLRLSELRVEIANTDTKDFREFLRKRIEFLEQFVYAGEGVGRSPQGSGR